MASSTPDDRGRSAAQRDPGLARFDRDGLTVTVAETERNKVSGPLRFRDGDGQTIPIKPGQTWVALSG